MDIHEISHLSGHILQLMESRGYPSNLQPSPHINLMTNMEQTKIKKEKHIKVERKRRFNINDRIYELNNLLPEDVYLKEPKKSKGEILKDSVGYVKRLKVEE